MSARYHTKTSNREIHLKITHETCVISDQFWTDLVGAVFYKSRKNDRLRCRISRIDLALDFEGMFFIPDDVDAANLWEAVAEVLDKDAIRPTVTRVKNNRLMMEFTWEKTLPQGDARDKRYGCT
jgi:hypothetical protein